MRSTTWPSTLETFGDQRGDPNPLEALVGLLRQSKPYGVHFLVTAATVNTLSNRLLNLFTERYTLRLSSVDDYPSIVGSRVAEIDEIAGRGYTASSATSSRSRSLCWARSSAAKPTRSA